MSCRILKAQDCVLNIKGTKFEPQSTISQLEKSLIWRRANKVYDVEAMAKEVEPEVCWPSRVMAVALIVPYRL